MTASIVRIFIGQLVGSAAVLAAATMAASAADITMIASNAVKVPYLELLPAFETATGHRVIVSWAGTDDIARRLREGEAADIVIAPSFTIEALIGEGHLAEGSRHDVAKSIIGVAARAGAPKPDLASKETLKRSLLAAKSIVLSSGPSGKYLPGLFREMGIWDQVKAKTTQLAPGESPGESLARGEGDIGFTQVSELLAVKGIDYIGALPSDIQKVTVFAAGLPKNRRGEEAVARALVQFLTGPDVIPVLKKTGLDAV